MNETNLKQAQKEIDEALSTIEKLEENIKFNSVSEDMIKENFISLAKKVQEIESVLKNEGIL
ncbi:MULTISPECIES: hypothetical protein [Clostridium]|uniref:Uncharacterized protein n=1 Tax=Clostridium sulfidigenes TaxID=318464 RepID=A0A084JF54_9CLOT|nr:hypothetical protein [Clostridium sulfidigenes]HAR87105.1 hypothetical protein [Clostridium sp.]KEZ87588.1 hypothetical protein IO99_04795 [Clostridium sulfidigenes]MBE6061379.1 hypothetical protein [Clostridium sulfidigenes]HBA03435.1 hypothetical protein [Clostridium sp.]HBL05705.1 hypothetical protein [Clostridium sp.]